MVGMLLMMVVLTGTLLPLKTWHTGEREMVDR